MAQSFQQENEYMGTGSGGFGGFGFSGGWLLMAVIVLWFLFKDGHRDGYHDGGHRDGNYFGHGFENGFCGGFRPVFHDESNWEQEKHLCREFERVDEKLCKVDRDVWENGCKDREAIHCEGEKTRSLIEANYIQDLRDKLTEKNAEVATLKSEAFTRGEISGVMSAIGKIGREVEEIECKMLKKPEMFGCATTPELVQVGRDFNDFRPRRSRCEFADAA